MRTLADFRRAAVPGSRWESTNHLHPHASGLRIITKAGPKVLSYDATKADGAVVDGRMEIPKANAVRFEGDSVHFLDDDLHPYPPRVAYTWTLLPGVGGTDPLAFEIDQTKVDAPNFPRDLSWWAKFVPMWVDVTEAEGGVIRLTVDSQARAGALDRWLATCGGGRLAQAYQPAPRLASVGSCAEGEA
jgi:hypothetical protein